MDEAKRLRMAELLDEMFEIATGKPISGHLGFLEERMGNDMPIDVKSLVVDYLMDAVKNGLCETAAQMEAQAKSPEFHKVIEGLARRK